MEKYETKINLSETILWKVRFGAPFSLVTVSKVGHENRVITKIKIKQSTKTIVGPVSNS